MSHFHCEHCGKLMVDTDRGYITGCEHYKADIPPERLTRRERILVESLEKSERPAPAPYPWLPEPTD